VPRRFPNAIDTLRPNPSSVSGAISANPAREQGQQPIQQLLETIADRLQKVATVRTVFGDPITAEGKAIIPVASVGFGFGGGSGIGQPGEPERKECGRAGAGGGLGARPVGVVEITEKGTRFIAFGPWRNLVLACGGGVLIGLAVGRRLHCCARCRHDRPSDIPGKVQEKVDS
jgi:uncharacterized spore protein YtfJ